MGALNFRSRLAPYIIGLIEQKRALGYKYTAQVKILQKFDMLCAERFSEDSTVTKAMLDVWAVKGPEEAPGIRLCNRPFATIEEMDETLIRNWNAKVTNGDTVYILGDLLFRNEKPAEEYLKQLKGKKHLIIGNHDRDWVKKCNLKDFFESVNNLHFISDGKRQMTLCHYPMMSWPHMTRCYMVFGHIHGNTDADYWPLIRENDLMLNAGADVNGFAPVTFEEMQENNYRHKAGWNPELCTMEADQ